MISVPPGRRPTSAYSAPTAPAHGSVITQAAATFPATDQRVPLQRRFEPEPRTLPVITWVVEIGKPKSAARQSRNAADVCAATPARRSRSDSFRPIVLTIRQPPT